MGAVTAGPAETTPPGLLRPYPLGGVGIAHGAPRACRAALPGAPRRVCQACAERTPAPAGLPAWVTDGVPTFEPSCPGPTRSPDPRRPDQRRPSPIRREVRSPHEPLALPAWPAAPRRAHVPPPDPG